MDFDLVDRLHSTAIETFHYRGNINEIQYRGPHSREWPGQLYIGDWESSQNYFLLRALNIDTVVNVTDEVSPFFDRFHDYIHLDVNDTPDADDALLFKMQKTNVLKRIRDGLCLGNVLLHCRAGISRSATVTLCYLMTYEKMSKETAIDTIQRCRNCAFLYRGKFYFNFPKTIEFYSAAGLATATRF